MHTQAITGDLSFDKNHSIPFFRLELSIKMHKNDFAKEGQMY